MLLWNTGQKATAVAESPTSNRDEHGLIWGGGVASVEGSDPHGPHTITWANTHTHTNETKKNTTSDVKNGS